MMRTSANWSRSLLSAAVIAVVALPGAPAAAAANLPDLRVAWDPGAGTIGPPGAVPGMVVNNRGTAAATGVTVTVDLTSVDDRVRIAIAGENPICALAGRVVTCDVGTLETDSGRPLIPMTLTLAEGAAPGDNGAMVATVAGDQADQDPASDTATAPVRIVTGTEPEPSPIALVADLNTAARRVGPGQRRPVYAAVRNDGDAPLTGFRVSVLLPIGAALVERYRDCAYSSQFPDGGGRGYRYFPTQVECHLSQALAPGETLPLFDPATGTALFHARFGRNLSGPDELPGLFVAVPEQDPHRPDSGDGPSFAEAVRRLPVLAAGVTPDGRPDLHGDQAMTPFSVFTRPNRFDITLTRPEFHPAGPGSVGFQFQLVNNGPSDSGPVEYVVTAPSGTVLTQAGAEECHTLGRPGTLLPESAALVCTTPAPFPTARAGTVPHLRNFVLDIKATPGAGGRIAVRGTGVGSTESRWSNNVRRLVLPSAGRR
ncbi:peptidase [Jidongwangia harbinensis]|uniref:peptidase n=1 Tax=Jidongwangia harbinensis TaxID=2878561 RepID=UPI001CDA475D|nr:peptidase [Jidongwangia harbinensis]MCA2219249.1 peptidase [Jidongwangia harbinensis]